MGKMIEVIDSQCQVDSVSLMLVFGIAQMTPRDTVAQQVDFVNLIHSNVAPAGETQCTKVQNMQFIKASKKLASCVGIDFEKKVDLDTKDMQELAKKCTEVGIAANSDACAEAIRAEKVYEMAVRDIYQHPNTLCSCLPEYKKSIPSCSVLAGSLIDDSGEQMPADFDETYRGMKFSLGFMKSMLCVAGLGCGALKDACVDQLNTLDKCLGENPACESAAPSKTCEESLFFPLPPELSQGQLPDVCLQAYRDNKMTSSVVSDYANFVQSCHPEVMTVLATKQDAKPTAEKSSGWISALVTIGVIAAAVFGSVMAVIQMRKRENAGFERLDTEEPTQTELELS